MLVFLFLSFFFFWFEPKIPVQRGGAGNIKLLACFTLQRICLQAAGKGSL